MTWRVLLVLAIACGEAWAQPIPQGGLRRVTTTSALEGAGTLTSPLGLRTDCDSSETLAWDGDSWECTAMAGAVSDGDYGDITVSMDGTVWSVDSGAVAYSELSGAFTTSNAIPKGNGSGLVASSITDDGTTVSTTSAVSVSNRITTRSGTASDGTLSFTASGDIAYIQASEDGTSGSSAALYFTNGLAQARWMVLDASGNLGIGSDTTPDAKLDVQGTLQVDGAATFSSTGSFTGNLSTNGTLDVNSNLAKFGATDGTTYITNNGISGGYNTNGLDALYLSMRGYQNGTTQFRDTIFGDGKDVEACRITGSTKTLNCVGGLQVNGTAVNAFTTNNTIPKGNGSGLVASSITDDGTTVSHAGNTQLGSDSSNTVYAPGTVGIGVAADGTIDLKVADDVQLGDASTDRIGIGIAPDSNHAMTFADATGPKIALRPVSSTQAYGFGVQTNQLQYFVDTSNGQHAFGHGDSDAFTVRQQFLADGRVRFGDTTGTAIANNVDVVEIGNTGTGHTSSRALINATHTGSFDTTSGARVAVGFYSSISATRSAGANNLTNKAATFSASGAQTNIALETDAGDVRLNFSGGRTTFYGALYSSGTTPTLSTCGTNPSVEGSDVAGRVTVGSSPGGACTVTFDVEWENTPTCVITPKGDPGGTIYISSESTTAFTVSVDGTIPDFNYHCIGR